MTTKRKTRLKGTETEKPCFDCGVTKDRFKDFKPRWAGCATHRTERGRRYLEPGCADCLKLVNGNIRQPRCIDCDRQRPKKRKATKATKGKATKATKVKATKAKATPVVAVNPTPEPKAEPVAEATPVVIPEPEPEPEPKQGKTDKTSQAPKRPKLTSMADLSALFDEAE